MPFAAGLSTRPSTQGAFQEILEQVLPSFSGPPDLALLFYSGDHLAGAAELAASLQDSLQPRCLIGCPGETIIGQDREVEDGPALSLWLGKWSRPVQLTPFRLELEETPDGYSLMGWPDAIASVDPKQSAMLLLGDPFTFPTDVFLKQVNEAHPGLRVMGGMASAGRQAGENVLIWQGQVLDQGAVGVLMEGPAPIRSVVSQGCRPIGRHMVVTRAQDNIIAELGGKSPLAQMQKLWTELSSRDQDLVRGGLHIGRVINEYQGQFRRGDFLIRNVMGMDRETGSLAITDKVRVGQTVQFHVRDAATADEDLHAMLQADRREHPGEPQAALLFSCNGRGTHLFPEPNHDVGVLRQEAGPLPVAGFFAMGELGPIGGLNFIHGFTASVVLFEE